MLHNVKVLRYIRSSNSVRLYASNYKRCINVDGADYEDVTVENLEPSTSSEVISMPFCKQKLFACNETFQTDAWPF